MVVGPPRGRWSWAVAVGDRGQARGRGVREHLAAAGERVPLGAGGVRVHLAGVVGGAGEVEGDLRDLGGEGAEGEGSEHEGMHDGESDITVVLFGMRGFGMKCDLIFFRGVNQWHPESVISAAAANQ